MFRLLSSSNYLSYRSIVFEANVESSNVSVDIRQEYGIFFLQANNSEPPDYSWSAALYKNCIARFFKICPHSRDALVVHICMVSDREGPSATLPAMAKTANLAKIH